MTKSKVYEGFIKQEYISKVIDLLPKDSRINLNSMNDTLHLSLIVEFSNEDSAIDFKNAVIPYTARF